MRRSRALLGTFVEITTSDGNQTAIDAAFEAIQTVHDLLSFHSIESELTRLNLAQGTEVPIHPIPRRSLLLAKGMAKASGHQFNPSTGASLVAASILPDHGFDRCAARSEAPFGGALLPGERSGDAADDGPPTGDGVRELLGTRPLSAGEIATKLGLPIRDVIERLVELDLAGFARAWPGGRYTRS